MFRFIQVSSNLWIHPSHIQKIKIQPNKYILVTTQTLKDGFTRENIQEEIEVCAIQQPIAYQQLSQWFQHTGMSE